MGWLDRVTWFQTLVTWWRTRHLSDREFRQELLSDVIETRNEIFDHFKDEPADRELIEAFAELDQFIEDSRARC